ncbi:MAG: nucleoside 2-deoxyribosyltransferase [Thermoflexales bacterium]
MKLLYIAGPLFNSHERHYLEAIAAAFEQRGFKTFLPHRDAGVITEWGDATRKRVFAADLAALDACDGCVALLTGADHDSGTCVELGYLYALGKPCFGLTDDLRSNTLNNMVWGVCDDGRRIARALDEVVGQVLLHFSAAGG